MTYKTHSEAKPLALETAWKVCYGLKKKKKTQTLWVPA